jgi:hypothetical protein
MIYKFFPYKDSFINSYIPYLNVGLDEILEVSSNESIVNRTLLAFDNTELNNYVTNITGSAVLSSSLSYFDFHQPVANGNLTTDGEELTFEFLFDIKSLVLDTNASSSGQVAPITGDYYTWQRDVMLPKLREIYGTSYYFDLLPSNSLNAAISGYSSSFTALSIIPPYYDSSSLPSLADNNWGIIHSTFGLWYGDIYFATRSAYASDLIDQNEIEFYLKLYAANVTGLNNDVILDIFPVSSSWEMGLGKWGDTPIGEDGVSWTWRTFSGSDKWATQSYSSNVTASYDNEPGGGTWYSNSSVSYSGSYYGERDLNVNVSNIVKRWLHLDPSIIDNNGFIIKLRDEFNTNTNYKPYFKFFSRDTHTIYPPYLEVRWDDYVFATGSSSQTINNNEDTLISIKTEQNNHEYNSQQTLKTRIYSRPKTVTRTYQTSSVYTQNYYLPLSSSYAILDGYTNEYVIQFDDVFTRISADETSNYFNLDLNGLEPQRFYKILIKFKNDTFDKIIDDNLYFKIK